MEILPKNLNIPLERNDRLRMAFIIVGSCVLAIITLALVSLQFALVFFASCVVVLPLILYILVFRSSSNAGNTLIIAASIGYFSFAKSVLIPLLVGVIQHVLA